MPLAFSDLTEEYIDIEEESDNGTFDKLSLSSSLESLLDEHFLSLLRFRRQFNIGWAAAEELNWRSRELQKSPAILATEIQEARYATRCGSHLFTSSQF
ncbi:hypothetical protein AZE42_06639 [Rhizopogon vesiculosus]|uniref:Uncharacterized protein n=1 Tax=Rhizopogon vesiculosus TaxID=180088 RepID=A0A1J8Q4B5_9AGAM|nr:hypothetical protein AZE42_06639 [Rhizopogon vesiculosus]